MFLLLGMEAIRTYRTNPHLVIGTHQVPTWTTPIVLVLVVSALIPGTSLLGHLCGLVVGYLCESSRSPYAPPRWFRVAEADGWLSLGGMGYLKFLAPPDKALRWIEGKLSLLESLPHYVSVDQKTYGRFGVLPGVGGSAGPAP